MRGFMSFGASTLTTGSELALLVLEEAEELRGGGAGLDFAEVDVSQREARQRLMMAAVTF